MPQSRFLSELEAYKIQEEYKKTPNISALARKFGRGKSTIWTVIHGKWRKREEKGGRPRMYSRRDELHILITVKKYHDLPIKRLVTQYLPEFNLTTVRRMLKRHRMKLCSAVKMVPLSKIRLPISPISRLYVILIKNSISDISHFYALRNFDQKFDFRYLPFLRST